MDKKPEFIDTYRQGYFDGYRNGYNRGLADGRLGVQCTDESILHLPVEAMGISVRACGCLTRANCHRIEEVAFLREERICVMRNLGPKTACEIAQALHGLGITHTAWDKYL